MGCSGFLRANSPAGGRAASTGGLARGPYPDRRPVETGLGGAQCPAAGELGRNLLEHSETDFQGCGGIGDSQPGSEGGRAKPCRGYGCGGAIGRPQRAVQGDCGVVA